MVFDELRFGRQVAIDKTYYNDEKGSFYQFDVFFDPFDRESARDWKDSFMRPRVLVGATIATANEASSVFGGFSWDAKLSDRIFLEAGLGAMIHNGQLKNDFTPGPKLGCRALFREYVAVGYELTDHWNIIAQADHSSHLNFCGDTNNGLTRGGFLLGYKF